MAQNRRRWQVQRATEAQAGPPLAPSPPAFTIALSREAGTNGLPIAQALGERLGWEVYDRELLQKIAEEIGLRAEVLEAVDVRRQGWLQECLEAFASFRALSAGAFVRHLVEMLLALASHGRCVLIGRGAAQVLPAATTLRVRLVGPVEERVEAVRQRLAITHAEAVRWVERVDGERTRFVRDHFRKDPTDPRLYDLVLNSSRFPAVECAEIIIESLKRLQALAPTQRAALLAP
jgi:cytidylate kinase